MKNIKPNLGFTLIEMIVVIVITGILGGIVAVFLKVPIQGYMDSARRAEMTDIADTALRRIERDLRTALPNSIRVWGSVSGNGSCNGTETCYMEYLETIAGGRYNTTTTPADCLNNSALGGCTALTTTGDLVSDSSGTLLNGQKITVGTSSLVVYNQYNNSGSDCSPSNPSVYCAAAKGGATVITGVSNGVPDSTQDVISFASTTFLPSGGSPYNRFQIVSWPVTYMCDPTAGTLTRYWGYAIQDVQTKTNSKTQLDALVNPPTTTRGSALLASNVSACNFTYDTSVVAQSYGLVTMTLTISEFNSNTSANESVSLYSATHVSNIP